MKSLTYLATLTITLFLFSACGKKSTPTPVPHYIGPYVNDTLGPVIQLDSFPLKVGNMWVYDNGDTIRAVSDTIINGNHAVRVIRNNDVQSVIMYFANMPGGFYQISGYSRFPGFAYSSVMSLNSTDDSLILYQTPAYLANFAADTDVLWNSFKTYGNRHWMKYVQVTTPLGVINCKKMFTEYGYEYYSDKGIVKVLAPLPVALKGGNNLAYTTLVYVNF